MGRLHTRAYQAIPVVYPELGVSPRLVHAADTAPDRARFARDVLGYARASADYRAVLADPEVDVVSICAPNHVHREIAVAAAQAGKPFWIEKPVGRSVTETAEVAGAARAAGGEASSGYHFRRAPSGRSCPWAPARTSPSLRTVRWLRSRTTTTPPHWSASPPARTPPAPSAPLRPPASSSARSVDSRSRSTAPRAPRPGTSSS